MRSWLVRWYSNCSQAKSGLSALDLPSPIGNCRTVWVRYKGRLWKVQRDLLNTSDHKNTWNKVQKIPETRQEGPVVRSSLSYSYDLLSSPKWSVQSLSAARQANSIQEGLRWGYGREGSSDDGHCKLRQWSLQSSVWAESTEHSFHLSFHCERTNPGQLKEVSKYKKNLTLKLFPAC